ncbi:hypothetical protein NON00_20605 [Roseomonas sp. GC11]|uniref:hypothetical protein n=1 Tax=Roseomonas sp. GC11 TaxID=2950546 RepID=UPI00210A46A5|nr:hypothetical protein [Roseomonas sp. GC11]MCQ4162317.1 hypothetical protein [Roseomonas sp. GC11]
MAEMLRAAERDRLIVYLEQMLLRDVTLGGAVRPALRPTPASAVLPGAPPGAPPDAAACRTEDAAVAAELLSLPALRPRWATLADGLTDLLLAQGETAVLLAHAAPASCAILSADPRALHIVTATHEFRGDLSRGLLWQVAHGRPEHGLHHTGHLVQFQIGFDRFTLDVEDAITDQGVLPQPDGALLFHESTLKVKTGLLVKRERVVARLRYEYRIIAGDPRLHMAVTLRAEPGIRLRRVRLATAVDGLSTDVPRPFSHLALGSAGGGGLLPAALPADGAPLLREGPASFVSLVEEAPAEAALGLHLAPAAPGAVVGLRLEQREGRPHWLLLRHGTDSLPAGGSLEVREARLLTLGTLAGEPATYAALLRDGALAGRGPGLCPDPGVVLHALATQIRHDAAGAYEAPLPPGRREALLAWCRRHLDALFARLGEGTPEGPRPGRLPLRSLAFTLLALDALHHATGEEGFLLRLRAGLALLLAQQNPAAEGGAFALPGRPPLLADHAAALLALAVLAPRRLEPRLEPALRQGLAALQQRRMMARVEGEEFPLETPLVRAPTPEGGWVEDGALTTLALGLMMRALQAVRAAGEAGAVTLAPAEMQHAQALLDAGFQMLRRRVRERGQALEILAGAFAGEGSAEAQLAVLLGLTAPEVPPLRQAAAPAAAPASA